MSKLKTSWDDHYMYPAFVGFLIFALKEPNILAQYRAETGDKWVPGTTPIDRMIDGTTGADLKFFQSFSDFCERVHFGTPSSLEHPSQVRENV